MRTGWACMPLLAAMLIASPASAQSGGVTIPSPGSAPTVSGPNSVNPSAAASDLRSSGAVNPNSAVSATGTPNALNPSGTPSTFAPTSAGGVRPVLQRSSPAATRIGRRRSRMVARPSRRPAARRAAILPPAAEARSEKRARGIVGSVCRGC